MAEWESLTLSDIIPTEVPEVIGQLSSVIDAFAGITSNLASFIETVGLVILPYTDPLIAISAALKETIDGFVSGLLEANVYVLPIPLGRPSDNFRRGIDGFIKVIEDSIYDTSDPNRPFITGAVGSVSIIILVGAPSLEEIIDKSQGLGELFNLEQLKIDDIVFNLSAFASLSSSLISSLTPQTITLTGDISLFPDTGIVKIGDEITTYASKSGSKLNGIVIRKDHSADEEVSVVIIDKGGLSTSTKTTTDLIGTGLPTVISVETTNGFPSSGSIIIDSEEIFYSSKTDTAFFADELLEDHLSGVTASLREGRSFHGSPPDWDSRVLAELFVDMQFIIKALDNISASLEAATNIADEIIKFARILLKRIEQLRAKLSAILEAIARFIELLSLTGVYVLTVTHSGSASDFIDAIKEAEKAPEFDEYSYTTGLVITAGVESASLLLEFFA